MDTKRLLKALAIGAVLGISSVGLFLLMYLVVLSGTRPEVRLFGSFFTPIFALAILIGGYYLLIAKRKRQ